MTFTVKSDVLEVKYKPSLAFIVTVNGPDSTLEGGLIVKEVAGLLFVTKLGFPEPPAKSKYIVLPSGSFTKVGVKVYV